jgi:hypothetical protein
LWLSLVDGKYRAHGVLGEGSIFVLSLAMLSNIGSLNRSAAAWPRAAKIAETNGFLVRQQCPEHAATQAEVRFPTCGMRKGTHVLYFQVPVASSTAPVLCSRPSIQPRFSRMGLQPPGRPARLCKKNTNGNWKVAGQAFGPYLASDRGVSCSRAGVSSSLSSPLTPIHQH